ncbi:hypothetical protein JCGZ_20719 [Jatropha curcas]|uniref:Uncharacterized protein n=1 Tax=Jatropha curcas TaxID=180498 RepID=A0A067JRU3_JATCU|nr:hypothetical protein JCGZ_20719 [Jatropha curcas]
MLPPGPAPLPIVGNLFDLGDRPHNSLAELAKIHGPLMSLKLGQITTVIISSAVLAKQVLQTHDLRFSNRTVIQAIKTYDHHQVSLPWLPVGPLWRNLRKICNCHIFTNQKLDENQGLRFKKIQELLSDVQESCSNGVAIDIGQAAFKVMLNSLSSTVFSLDLSDSSSDIVREFKKAVRGIMDEAGKPNLEDFFPFLRRIDPQGIMRRMNVHVRRVLDVFDRIIDERMVLRKEPGYIPANDMLDTLLSLEQNKNEEMDRNCMKHLFVDLFSAGTDTTSSTLEWAMTELLRNPKIYLKAQIELEQTIGKGKLPEESDVPRLPYLQAIIKETLRLHPPTPFLLPRIAGENVEMAGYVVPKGAQVLVNAWAIGRDPSRWENPDSFMPERFLGSDIDIRGRDFELIPFGAGRRICPGLLLAIRMLHMMLASLINSFDWKLEDGVTPENIDMEDRCYKLCIRIKLKAKIKWAPSYKLIRPLKARLVHWNLRAGNLLELGDKPHKSLAKVAKIHGPLMSLKLGQVTTVVISSAALGKQFLQTFDPSFCNRTVGEAIQARGHQEVSLAWALVGGPWRNLRRICSPYISNQKLDSNQVLLQKKIQELVDQVEESCRLGAAVDIGQVAFKATLNVLSTTIVSLDLSDSSSDAVRELQEVVSCIMEQAGKSNLADYYPLLRKIDPQGIKRRMVILFGKIFHLFDRIMDERLSLRKQQGHIPPKRHASYSSLPL